MRFVLLYFSAYFGILKRYENDNKEAR